jgi:hypothetical protein
MIHHTEPSQLNVEPKNQARGRSNFGRFLVSKRTLRAKPLLEKSRKLPSPDGGRGLGMRVAEVFADFCISSKSYFISKTVSH